MAFQTTNPANNKVLKSFDEMTPVMEEKAVSNAANAFNDWKKTDFKERSQLLYKVAGLLRAKKKELAEIITLEADEFLKKFKNKFAELIVGDPMEEATELGPLCSEAAAVNILEQVNKAVKGGAKILLGGKRVDREGAYMQATILTNVEKSNPVFYEEFFGPVALFFKVKNEEEAILLANDSPFGLGGSVFTQDIERGKRVANLIDTGMVFINHPTWTQADLPFGGTKGSGYGREMAELGLDEFVNKKLIRISELSDPF